MSETREGVAEAIRAERRSRERKYWIREREVMRIVRRRRWRTRCWMRERRRAHVRGRRACDVLLSLGEGLWGEEGSWLVACQKGGCFVGWKGHWSGAE